MPPAQRTLRRRFLLLTAVRWFPGGLMLPVLVLLLQARGLDLVTIGALFAMFSALVALLEVPTGGLADVVGRRQVSLASSLLTTSAFVMLALARESHAFAVALIVFAIGRALSSGPLQAWYVDAAQSIDPHVDLQPALAREGLVSSWAIGLGIVVGGLLPGLTGRISPGVPSTGSALLLTLTVPVWLAAVLLAGATATIAVLMTAPPKTQAQTSRRAGLRLVLNDVPRTVARSLNFARRDREVRAVLLSVAATGLVISATEVLAPAYFASLVVADPAYAATVYSGLLTAVFFASGFGSAAAPLIVRVCRGPMRGAAVALTVCGLAYALLGGSSGLVLAASGYIAVYLVLGAVDPLRLEQLHHRADQRERSTVLSLESMAQMLGGVVGALAVPLLAANFGYRTGWFACVAVALLAAAVVSGVGDARPRNISSSIEGDNSSTAAASPLPSLPAPH